MLNKNLEDMNLQELVDFKEKQKRIIEGSFAAQRRATQVQDELLRHQRELKQKLEFEADLPIKQLSVYNHKLIRKNLLLPYVIVTESWYPCNQGYGRQYHSFETQEEARTFADYHHRHPNSSAVWDRTFQTLYIKIDRATPGRYPHIVWESEKKENES